MLPLWEDLKRHYEAFKNIFHLLHLHSLQLVILRRKYRLKRKLHKLKLKLNNLSKLSNW